MLELCLRLIFREFLLVFVLFTVVEIWSLITQDIGGVGMYAFDFQHEQ